MRVLDLRNRQLSEAILINKWGAWVFDKNHEREGRLIPVIIDRVPRNLDNLRTDLSDLEDDVKRFFATLKNDVAFSNTDDLTLISLSSTK